MPLADFVHLHLHSAYSLLEGTIRLKQLVQLCRENAMPAVAVTDSNNLFGALEFASLAVEAGVQPIVGCRLNVTRADKAPRGALAPLPDPLVLLAQTPEGLANLMQLCSAAHLEADPALPPQISLEALEVRAAGLLCLTGGPQGGLARLLREGQRPAAEALLERLQSAFPGRLYIELQRHDTPEELASEPGLLELAFARDLPLVATNEPFFATEDLFEAHDALLAIAEGAALASDERRRVTPQHYFKSAAEMRQRFADLPEACDNTLAIARRCAAFPEKAKPMLPAFATAAGHSEAEELALHARAGLDRRLATLGLAEAAARPYLERLDYELAMIARMGFPGYFLIVADFIQWAKQQGIPVGPGRGSGAGSVVAWALTITDLDPLRWGLLFERFLNPERVSMPDFDIDFCQDRRDEVIAYVRHKYGADRVAQIITFMKLQARAVLRDVGRVLGMPYGYVDKLCKLVPNNPANPVTLKQAIEGEPQLQAYIQSDETVARLMDIAQKLEGLNRNHSTHAAGLVIGDRPLAETIPLTRDPRSAILVTQYNMKYVEEAGLVKFDFLGLKTLTVLAEAEALIRQQDADFRLDAIPLDDPRTFALLSRAETVGVFQLESSGMRDVLKRLRPDRFEDIIAVVALYRPGPMDNIPSYIARKHGDERPDYLYPTLEGILKETFGIMIYQEQVMQIAQELSGYSLGGADLLRRAMGKKIKSEMEAQKRSFIDGAVARGVPAGKAEQIFDQVEKFAGYGFNKSHAAAYALVAYQTAFLKANHPVEFLAASMTHDLGNTDKLNVFRQELDRLRIRLLPPDLNRSRPRFAVEGEGESKAIRYALGALKGVGIAAMEQLVAVRDRQGPFRDLADFAGRLDSKAINKRTVESLAAAGVFDSLEPNRRRIFEAAETVVRRAQAEVEARGSAQVSLFGGAGEPSPLTLPEVPPWAPLERLQREFDAVGFYLSAHPLDGYAATLRRLGVVRAVDLPAVLRDDPGRKKLAGIVIDRQERTSKRGSRFAFVQLSDQSGIYEVMLFEETLVRSRDLLESGQPLLLSVDARGEGEDRRLMAQSLESLEQAAASAAQGLCVYVRDPAGLPSLKALLARESRGRGKVAVVLDLDAGEELRFELAETYRLTPAVRQAIKGLTGMVVEDI